MITLAARARDAISFGPFSLTASERLLTKQGVPVEIGGRSLDILIALLSRPNEVVSKRDLLARVWSDVTVEEGSLRFHVASLRKALGDRKDGARYITTLPGRGYCFVAPISRASDQDKADATVAASSTRANLPSPLIRMVGRADDVVTLSSLLAAERFVTIVGAGGVGKTTVAVAVGHHLIEAFAGAALFVDLGALNDPTLAATALASMLGLSVQSDDATPSLIAYLREKRILLILDNCEHLIDAVAALAARIFAAAPQVHILATSREALRVEGEHVYKLAPLACPPDDPALTAAVAQTFPAMQLFLERAAAGGARLDLSDTDAAIVASICRKLDGVALAIELAAGRVEAYGLQQTAALLEQRITLLGLGQRTAPIRTRGASPARRVRRIFYDGGGAGGRNKRDRRSSRRLWRHRQPGRQVDGRCPSRRGDDALPAVGYDPRLRPRNQRRGRRTRRPSRAPRNLLPPLAGADRNRMADLVARGGTSAPPCRFKQCARRVGMVLWRQRQC